jgi:glycosyltransferase involved in cell wall biosynthesis
MLKVLYLPLNTPEGTQSGMCDAWNNVGVELHIFDFYMKFLAHRDSSSVRREFIQVVQAVQPDLVHMQLQFTGVIDYETLRQAKLSCPKTIFVNWSGDLRKNVPTEFVSLSSAIDYSLVSNVGQIELYRAAGCHNCRYWQIGYDPKICFPQELPLTYDVTFTGNMYQFDTFPDVRLRLEAAKAIKNKYGARAGVFGNGYPSSMGRIHGIKGAEVNNAYCASHTVLSISNFNDVSYYFSDRLLACLASGRPTICYRFPGVESYFTHNSDLIVVNSIAEIISAVDFCVKNPQLAKEIGRNGYLKVKAEHTHTSRVLELLRMLNLIHRL